MSHPAARPEAHGTAPPPLVGCLNPTTPLPAIARAIAGTVSCALSVSNALPAAR